MTRRCRGVTGLMAAMFVIGSTACEKLWSAPPPNDDFDARIDLGNVAFVAVQGTNKEATLESSEPDHGFEIFASVWWS